MKVCITGAASTVARKLIEILAPHHQLTLVDIDFPSQFVSKAKLVIGSVCDRRLMQRVLSGQDAVVHMAIANGKKKTSEEEKWRVNVGGTLVVVQESAAANVKKFIYASSLSVFDGYGDLIKSYGDESLEPKPKSFYGFTKYLGEEITKFYAENCKIKAIVLRLIAVVPEKPLTSWASAVNPIIQTSARDVAEAFRLSLDKNLESNYEVFHITGRQSPWSYKKAKDFLGYEPKDAF
jgi:UDP-glucose 4-epimerase